MTAGEGRARPRARVLNDESLADHRMQPPEPAPEELIVRATHVEAPSRDWREDEPVEEAQAPDAALG